MNKDHKVYLDEMISENEIKTNYVMGGLSFILSIIFIFYILTIDYDADPNGRYMQLFLIGFLILLLASPIMCLIYRARKPWLKYLILIGYILTATCGTIFLESGLYVLLMMMPIAASCLYYDPKFTFIIGIVSIVTLTITDSLLALYLPILYPDVNFVILQDGIDINVSGYVYYYLMHAPIDRVPYFVETCKYLLIPMDLIFLLLLAVCYMITKRARTMIEKQADDFREKVANESELDLAASIQKNMLPKKIESNSHYEINYYIAPAKQVGGDFYDYFKISDNKMALIIADVSDKGVPASLFMAVCKTLISSSLLAGKSLTETVNKVNKVLFNDTSSGMFVTAFIAIVDLDNGDIECINAGHCAPIIMRNNGVFAFENIEPEIFLGAIEETEYKSHFLKLSNYEKLVLYTDGITEAVNRKDEMYGKNRLLSFLNHNSNLKAKDLLDKLVKDINNFENGAEPCDDMTMLIFTRKN